MVAILTSGTCKGVRAFRGHILKPRTDSEQAGDVSCLPQPSRGNRQSRLKGVWTSWAETPGFELVSLFFSQRAVGSLLVLLVQHTAGLLAHSGCSINLCREFARISE